MADDRQYDFDRSPIPSSPHLSNIDSEAALLGVLLSYPERIESVADILNAEDFAEGVHGSIYQAMVDAATAGRLANAFTLAPLFKEDKRFEKLGGSGYLFTLSGTSSGMIMAKEQAEQIAELAARRRLLSVLAACQDGASDIVKPLSELVDETDSALIAALERREGSSLAHIGDVSAGAIEEMEAILAGGAVEGAMSGLHEFDELTGGFAPAGFSVIAARPGMGKTALLCSLARGLASRGHGVGIVELEMERKDLARRMLCDMALTRQSSIRYDSILKGDVTREEIAYLRALQETMRSWAMEIEDRGGLTLSRLLILARRMRRRMAMKNKKLEVLFVDYLQLIRPDRKGMSPYEAASEVSRELKSLAKEMKIHVVALAQLNREVEKREDKRPELSDLRDSGQIEQDADMVMMLFREEYYLQEPKDPARREVWQEQLRQCQNHLQLIMRKRRNGKPGRRTIYYFTGSQAIRSKDWTS
jgi:replicative DNA helicase